MAVASVNLQLSLDEQEGAFENSDGTKKTLWKQSVLCPHPAPSMQYSEKKLF